MKKQDIERGAFEEIAWHTEDWELADFYIDFKHLYTVYDVSFKHHKWDVYVDFEIYDRFESQIISLTWYTNGLADSGLPGKYVRDIKFSADDLHDMVMNYLKSIYE